MLKRRSVNISRIRRLRYGVVIGIIIAIVVLSMWSGGFFSSLRLRLNSVRYASQQPTQGRIAIIAIDDQSLAEYGRFNTWSRTLYAELITALANDGAKVVAFDVLFADPSANPEEDEALAEAINQARRSENRTRVVMPVAGEREITTADTQSLQYVNFIRPTPLLSEYVRNFGFVNVTLDQDSFLRWQPVLAQSSDQDYYEVSLGVAAYLTYFNISYEQMQDERVLKLKDDNKLFIKDFDVPLDAQGRTLINYFGRPESDDSFEIYSFNDVLNGQVPPGTFENKLVLIGAVNATGLTDTYSVPIGLEDQTMSGVAVHANFVEMLFQEKFLTEQTNTSQAILIFVFALLVTIALSQLRWRFILFLTPLFVVVWVLGALYYGQVNLVVMNLFDPLAAIILPLPAALALNVYLETRRREWAELLLDSVVTASSQQLELDQVLETVARDTQRILDSKEVQILLWNDIARHLEHAYPPLEEGDTSGPISREIIRLATHALRTHELVETRKYIIIPLTWHEERLGAIAAIQSKSLNNPRRQMLNLFAGQTSSIIANVDLYRETRDLSELKTRMIRMASHDLKGPIGVVIGFSDLLIEDQKDLSMLDEEQSDHLDRIMDAAENMERIVNDILSMERFRSGSGTFKEYDLLEMVQEVVARYANQVKDKSQELTSSFPSDFTTMYGDREQLHEAVSNIVGNAIKYTPDGGKISVSLIRDSGYALITVKDNGPGIAKQAQERLFQEFYRVKTEETAHISGTGLGLSLVKSVITAHKGKVWVDSDTGKGATFFIQLPLPATMGVDLEKLRTLHTDETLPSRPADLDARIKASQQK